MIEVVAYQQSWVDQFATLKSIYEEALQGAGVPFIAVEHVGSTAVPGLSAKPVIDIDIVVTTDGVPSATNVLVGLGFDPRGEAGIPDRWAFWEPDDFVGTNTYVVVEGSLALRNHLAVRDLLRLNPDLRDEYGAIKVSVGAVAADIYEYGAGKSEILQRILTAAGFSESERFDIGQNQVPVTPRRR